MNGHAEPLLAMLIRDGKIPGITACDLGHAALVQEITGKPAKVRMPILFCNRCTTQLVFEWWAVNPVTQLELLCGFCGRKAEEDGETVHCLISLKGAR